MGQYIPVSTPADKTYQRNRALTHVISFLGEKYKENHNGIIIQMQSDYKVGMDYIDRKCGKGFKTTIRNLMNSTRKMTMFNAGYPRCLRTIHGFLEPGMSAQSRRSQIKTAAHFLVCPAATCRLVGVNRTEYLRRCISKMELGDGQKREPELDRCRGDRQAEPTWERRGWCSGFLSWGITSEGECSVEFCT